MRDRVMNYVLDDEGHAVPEPDTLAWGRWYEAAWPRRIVAKTTVGEAEISTVFLAMDHNHMGDGPPILWETLIFGGRFDQHMWRHSSVAEARACHAAIRDALTHGEAPPDDACLTCMSATLDGVEHEGFCRLESGHVGRHHATLMPVFG